ncbi:MAG: NAD(P)-dependent oxidoreductase [Bacteroidota bacterium]
MKVLVSGTSGHLGEAIARTLSEQGIPYLGVDLKEGAYTQRIGDLSARDFVEEIVAEITHVIHCATLHKPHVVTHSKTDFIQANVMSTLNLLEASKRSGVQGVIFTSTTSTFGDALRPKTKEAAVWVDEELKSQPKNVYGVSKTAAEDICQLFARNEGLPTIILKTSRFFWEVDDDPEKRGVYSDLNIKANEYLNRRVDIEDAVSAHLLALQKVEEIRFGKYIVSATSPFKKKDLADLNQDAVSVIRRLYPDFEALYQKLGWKMFPKIGRVYVNEKARRELGWEPKYDFRYLLASLHEGRPFKSQLAEEIGVKGYHDQAYRGGIYPVK